MCILAQALCRKGTAFSSSFFSHRTNSKYWTRDVQKVTSHEPAPKYHIEQMTIPLRGLGKLPAQQQFHIYTPGVYICQTGHVISEESAVPYTKSTHSFFLYCRRVCIGKRQKKVKKWRSRTRNSSARVPDHVKVRSKQIITEYPINCTTFFWGGGFFLLCLGFGFFLAASHQLEIKIFLYFCESMVSVKVAQQLSRAKRLAWQKPRE